MEFTPSGAEAFLEKLTALTKSNLTNEQFGVSRLAREMGMSRSSLHRKVKSQSGVTVSQFINRIRLEKSMELLKKTSLTISEVAMQSGFNSITYYTKCFKDQYGYPPAKYRRNEATVADSDKSTQEIVHPEMRKNRSAIVLILSSIIIIISVILLLHLFAPLAANQNVREKTIAVLPIRNDSPDKDNAYIINGFMEEILHKLTLIEDLDLVSRTSVEKYRNSDASIIEIGKELNVNYILEGSAQTIEGKTKIHLQLIDALSDKHLWSKPYKQDLSLDNMFEMQEEVALAVAHELEVVLASGEKAQLEQIPTKNIAAYNLYLLGKDYMNINLYSVDNQERYQALLEAKRLFEQAIELDSTFSDAYSVLGSIYTINLYYSAAEIYVPQSRGDIEKANSYLDSGIVILDKALYYNKDNHEALACKAIYYETKGRHEEANRIYEILSKNGHLAFEAAVSRYFNIEEYYNAIDSYLRYLQAKPDHIIVPPYLLRTMIVVFRKTGFPAMEKQVVEQLLSFNNDSLEYIDNMVMLENWQGNYQSALSYGLQAWNMDSTDSHCNLILGIHYYYLDDFTTALKYIHYYEKYIVQESGELRPSIIAGQVYLKNGMEEKARYHLEGGRSEWFKQIELNTPKVQTYYPYIELADVYLALGDQEKALEYLNMLKGLKTIDLVYLTILKNWPGFDHIRNEPQFLEVLNVVEETYQKEHNRIEKRLMREGMINS